MPHSPLCSRSSTFKEKEIGHKYGELTLVNLKGKKYKLSKLLVKSTFAMTNENIFMQLLESGNIKTKLSEKQTEQMKSMLKQYKTSKKFNTKPVKTEPLTVKTLELHNKIIEKEDTREGTKADFTDLSDASDEEPLGRGIRSKGHSRNQIRNIEEINTRSTELKGCPKPIDSCSDTNKSHVVSPTTTETLSKSLRSLLLKRKSIVKEDQKKEIPKQHSLPDTYSISNSLNQGNVTDNKFEKEERNIDNPFNYEDGVKNSNKVISDKESGFKHDDEIRPAEKKNEYTLEIVKKRKYKHRLNVK